MFLVSAFEIDKTPYKDDANAGAVRQHKMCIIEDHPNIADSSRTLAHEAGHIIGKIPDIKKGLMGPAGAGVQLQKDQINAINPSGV